MQIGIVEIGIFLAVFVILALILLKFGGGNRMNERAKKLRQRLHSPVLMRSGDTPSSLRRKQGDESLPLLQKLVAVLPNKRLLQARLERAGMSLSAERYVFFSIVVFITTTLAIVALGKSPWLGASLGIITGIGIPHFVVGMKAKRRLKAFIQLFPDGIDLIVRGLRSGLPVSESVKLVAQEVPEPVSSIFQSIADQMKLGVTLEDAMAEVARKLQCTEFNFFVTSIVLQRETGGNLSEILNNLSDVLRKRFMMRMKIKAMTSEAKASTYIVGALPFVVMIAVMIMSPGYMDPLFDDKRGNLAAIGAIMSLCTGITIMIKMAKFEI